MFHRRFPKNRRQKVKPSFIPTHGGFHRSTGDAVKPEDIDRQNVSRKTQSLIESQQLVDSKTGPLSKKGRKKRKNKDVEIIEGFKKFRWESDRTFFNRIQQETDAEVHQEMIKIKYEKPTPKGRPSHSAADLSPSSSKERKRNAMEPTEITVKADRHRQNEPKKKVFKHRSDPLNRKETIPFGERVDAPPDLIFPHLKTRTSSTKSTKKSDLLLHSVVNSATGSSWAITSSSDSNLHSSTIKCDDPSKQKLLEEERRRVIDVYRNLKRNTRRVE